MIALYYQRTACSRKFFAQKSYGNLNYYLCVFEVVPFGISGHKIVNC